jgi:hypothetical protein
MENDEQKITTFSYTGDAIDWVKDMPEWKRFEEHCEKLRISIDFTPKFIFHQDTPPDKAMWAARELMKRIVLAAEKTLAKGVVRLEQEIKKAKAQGRNPVYPVFKSNQSLSVKMPPAVGPQEEQTDVQTIAQKLTSLGAEIDRIIEPGAEFFAKDGHRYKVTMSGDTGKLELTDWGEAQPVLVAQSITRRNSVHPDDIKSDTVKDNPDNPLVLTGHKVVLDKTISQRKSIIAYPLFQATDKIYKICYDLLTGKKMEYMEVGHFFIQKEGAFYDISGINVSTGTGEDSKTGKLGTQVMTIPWSLGNPPEYSVAVSAYDYFPWLRKKDVEKIRRVSEENTRKGINDEYAPIMLSIYDLSLANSEEMQKNRKKNASLYQNNIRDWQNYYFGFEYKNREQHNAARTVLAKNDIVDANQTTDGDYIFMGKIGESQGYDLQRRKYYPAYELKSPNREKPGVSPVNKHLLYWVKQ